MNELAHKDQNEWRGIGHVPHEVHAGETTAGDRVCSFQIRLRDHGRDTWVRVNVYLGDLVELAIREIRPGSRVDVFGELMNRNRAGKKGASQLTEVRALDITVLRKGVEDAS